MGLIGTIVGTVANAVGSIGAGNAADKGYSRYQDMMSKRLDDIKAHQTARYYQDPNQKAENIAAQTNVQKLLNQQTEAAVNKGIVSGATDESVALQKQANAAAVASMQQQAAIAGEQQKEREYQNSENQVNAFTRYLADSKLQQQLDKAQQWKDATGRISSAAGAFDTGVKIGKTELTW